MLNKRFADFLKQTDNKGQVIKQYAPEELKTLSKNQLKIKQNISVARKGTTKANVN